MPTATDFKDYYTILGVSQTATPEEIKRDYRVVGLTVIVTLIGAAGIYAFERELPNGTIINYGTALWWTAIVNDHHRF